MNLTLWLLLGGLVLAALIWKASGLTLDRAIAEAISRQEVDALLALIRRLPPGRQPSAFNHAIRQIWDAYHRPLALPLIAALAQDHEDERIAQYWLRQVQEVEPELVKQLDPGFVESRYQPHVAAGCGDGG